jgi:membrane-bound ClpP family serine protease
MGTMRKRGHRSPMRMGEECEIADTNYNLNKLNQSMITRFMSIFRDPNVAKHLFLLYDKYVIVSADKVPNNILFVCKSH